MSISISKSEVDVMVIKARQQVAWSSDDYAIIGTTIQIVGEELCEALDIRAGQKVLDVAAGNGNASLAAARRWCDVVATDYVPASLERAQSVQLPNVSILTFAKPMPRFCRFRTKSSTWSFRPSA